jgi:hypothetical protein
MNSKKSLKNNTLSLLMTHLVVSQLPVKIAVYLATNQGVVGSIPASRTIKARNGSTA